jgi:hypothetical protein
MRVCYPIIRNRHGSVVWSGSAYYGDFKSAVEEAALRRAERACNCYKAGTPGILWADGSGEISAGRYFTKIDAPRGPVDGLDEFAGRLV